MNHFVYRNERSNGMEATSTHRVTMPRKVSDLIARRAKARSTSFSQEILGLVEDAIGRRSREENLKLVSEIKQNKA